jgi:hypothetical protein
MIAIVVGINHFVEVPKSDNPYVKLLVRLYKFLARKSFPLLYRSLFWADRAMQAAPMRPSTRPSCAGS